MNDVFLRTTTNAVRRFKLWVKSKYSLITAYHMREYEIILHIILYILYVGTLEYHVRSIRTIYFC